MGTKIYRESYLPGYQCQSARNTNEIPNNHNWPHFYGNKTIQNGQNCNNILPRTVTNFMSGYEKDALKQMMLSHEAAFKHQVSELHRLYKVQKEIMSEIKRNELYKHPIQIETPPSSNSLLHIATYEDALMRWHKSPFPEIDLRPSKARKKLFDLHLPADNYIDVEEENSDNSRISHSRNHKDGLGIDEMLDSKKKLFDLNEPFLDDDVEANGKEQIIYADGVGHTEPHLDSNFVANTTFSKLLSNEILKAIISRNNEIGNKIGSIDINLVCEVADIENEKKIDSNTCAGEDEITLVPSRDEFDTLAANALVAMSSFEEDAEESSEGSLEEALLWLSEEICKSGIEKDADIYTDKHTQTFTDSVCNEIEAMTLGSGIDKDADTYTDKHTRTYTDSVSGEIDDFEAMTLGLIELEEDEYMPIPLVFENTESTATSRTRRGNLKRLKRDFLREILPGMASLSRHEVAEDVQTFGGIMKAMGSSWPVLGKRRRRLSAEMAGSLDEPKVAFKPLMERINSVEIGWVKTTRKPRRQRGHAGNVPSINSS